MNVLVYIRPATKKYYMNLVKRAYPDAKMVTLSDFKHISDFWVGDLIYKKNINDKLFSDIELYDIRIRCRFLRSVKEKVANDLINNLAFGLDEYFSSYFIDIVLGGLIDNYSQDILERISKKHNVPYISFVGHFFNDYCRISVRGELCKLPRYISKEEVDGVLAQVLAESYKPTFKLNKPKTRNYMYYSFSRALFKKYVYFPIRKFIEGDPLNYHYNTVLPESWSYSSVMKKDINNYFTRINTLPEKIFTNSIYIPLHFSPEATVDYWADDPDLVFQDDAIIKLVTDAPPNLNLLIKEHPGMYLRRRFDFYEKLKHLSNVILIHPYESSNTLLNRVENVLVITGSVGVEALLRKKRVLSLSKNYYSNLHPNIFIVKKITEAALALPLQPHPNELFIYNLLQGLFKAKFYNNKSINNSDLDSMASCFSEYVEYINERNYC